MTETSFYWSNTAVGDGTLSPYSDDEFSDVWRKIFCEDRTTQGVLKDYENELLVSNPSGNTIRVATGAALVDGKFYETDANVDNTISTPTVSTRQDRVVLRKSFASQTVRAAILTGIEGGGIPALTQTDGTTWEIPLATITITTGASITITDERSFLISPLSEGLDTNAWILIEEKTIAGTETSIDFENIPQDYRNLIIIGNLRHQRAAASTELSMTLNDDTGANYNHQYVKGSNATASAAAVAGDNEAELGEIPAASGSANHFGYVEIEIPFYTQTNFYKTILAKNGNIPNVTAANFDIYVVGAYWLSVNAINKISLFSSGAAGTAFTANSQIYLYGVI